MSDYNQGNNFYDSDSFESDTEYHKKNVPRKTATSQSLTNRNEQIYKGNFNNLICYSIY